MSAPKQVRAAVSYTMLPMAQRGNIDFILVNLESMNCAAICEGSVKDCEIATIYKDIFHDITFTCGSNITSAQKVASPIVSVADSR
jgi:hypothetical protein